VEKLVDVMSEEALAIPTKSGNTALVQAINAGNYRMTACMLGKNNNLVSLKDLNSNIPAIKAIFNGHTELARFLYSRTPLEHLTQEKAVKGATLCTLAIHNRSLGNNLIKSNNPSVVISDDLKLSQYNSLFYPTDIALDLIRKCPQLALTQDDRGRSPLYALADTPNAFPSGDGLVFWKRWIYKYCKYQSLFSSLIASH